MESGSRSTAGGVAVGNTAGGVMVVIIEWKSVTG